MYFEAGTYSRFNSEKVLQDIFEQLENDEDLDQEDVYSASRIVHKFLSFYCPKIKSLLKIKDDGNFYYYRLLLKDQIVEDHRDMLWKLACKLDLNPKAILIASLCRNIVYTKLKGR